MKLCLLIQLLLLLLLLAQRTSDEWVVLQWLHLHGASDGLGTKHGPGIFTHLRPAEEEEGCATFDARKEHALLVALSDGECKLPCYKQLHHSNAQPYCIKQMNKS